MSEQFGGRFGWQHHDSLLEAMSDEQAISLRGSGTDPRGPHKPEIASSTLAPATKATSADTSTSAVCTGAGVDLPRHPGATPTSHLLECIRLQVEPLSYWRSSLPGDTPLSYTERMMRVDWKIRDVVPGYSHRMSRTRILANAPIRRLLRAERRRAFAAADSFMAALPLEVA